MATKTLRDYARGKDCQIGLPGCTPHHEGVCLAHWRDSSTGMRQKEHDLIGAWACPNCHDLVDGRVQVPDERRVYVVSEFLRGIIKTQQKVLRALKEGKVRLPK